MHTPFAASSLPTQRPTKARSARPTLLLLCAALAGVPELLALWRARRRHH